MCVNATADLRSEHHGVVKMLNIMDAMGARARMGEAPAVADLADVLEFLRVFVDRCHHSKEETLLFPAMRAAGITTAEPTLVALLADYDHGRTAVAEMARQVEGLERGEEGALTTLADIMSSYTALLLDHITREERDCFNTADLELVVSVKVELAEGYDRIEEEVVGHGVHERFHALLDRLGHEYLA